jgi:hypothetical protein
VPDVSGFQVGVTALNGPAQRFKEIGTDFAVAVSGASTATGSGAGAAGSPVVAQAAEVFRAGVQSVLGALGDDANLLGDKVQKAGATYAAVDKTAMPAGASPAGASPGGASPGGSAPGGSAPGGSVPAGSVPAGSAPGGSAPAGSDPGGSTGSGPTGGPAQPAATTLPAAPTHPAASAPAPAAPARVEHGDSLWTVAAGRLGPGASNAAIAAEAHRWYAANRDTIGPDPDRLLTGTTLRAPDPA